MHDLITYPQQEVGSAGYLCMDDLKVEEMQAVPKTIVPRAEERPPCLPLHKQASNMPGQKCRASKQGQPVRGQVMGMASKAAGQVMAMLRKAAVGQSGLAIAVSLLWTFLLAMLLIANYSPIAGTQRTASLSCQDGGISLMSRTSVLHLVASPGGTWSSVGSDEAVGPLRQVKLHAAELVSWQPVLLDSFGSKSQQALTEASGVGTAATGVRTPTRIFTAT